MEDHIDRLDFSKFLEEADGNMRQASANYNEALSIGIIYCPYVPIYSTNVFIGYKY